MLNCKKDGASNAVRGSSIDTMSTAIGEIDISDDEDDEDEKLFKDPPPKDECPICMQTMPYGKNGICGVIYHPCCGTIICSGCVSASVEEMRQGTIKPWCAMCRVPVKRTQKEQMKRYKERMKLMDAEAYFDLGIRYKAGDSGLPQDLNKALELWNRAAELGSIKAHYELGLRLYTGIGGEKDKKKAIQHYKLAAIGGHERARYWLGTIEMSNGNINHAIKHFIIAAKSGEEDSLKKVGEGYKARFVTKDEYANTLRAYQESVDEMKSKQREEAKVLLA